MNKIAGAVERSKNSKVGDVSATYVSLKSCPACCALRGQGCYAELGKVGMYVRKLDKTADERAVDGRDMARAEARAIDGLTGQRPLRLHVSGDTRTATNAKIVAGAAERYIARGAQKVWSYTHAWRDVPRRSWGKVSMLASCETVDDAARALKKGYAPAVVVAEHPADGRAVRDERTGVKLIPCPAQTRDEVTCESCRLCWNDDKLKADRAAITFAAHGPRQGAVRTMVYDGATK